MKVPPFKLDAWLAAHDFATPPIRYNIASSTGPLWTFAELMALGDSKGDNKGDNKGDHKGDHKGDDKGGDKGGGSMASLGDITLSYAPPQGSKLLRERVAALHAVDPDHVLMMTGASEALVALTALAAAPGGTVVIPKPVYPAVPVLARAWGLGVREYALDREQGFAQTAGGVLAAVDSSTRLVFVNTPHNPTGAVMPPAEQRKLAESLAERGIPLIVDEVYHPLYFGERRPSASALPNTIVLGDFAKALSIPGLRIGWLIDADARRREALMDLRSYFTISGSPLTEAIGAHALAHAPDIIARLTQVAQGNLALLARFMDEHRAVLGWAPPQGGTTCFPWLRDGRDARPLCEALAKAGVLAAPGDCFEMPSHIRVGFGAMRNGYAEALAIFSETLARL